MTKTETVPANLSWKTIEGSTAVSRVAYELLDKQIYVEFVRGVVYRYDDCSPEDYHALLEAKSTGAHVPHLTAGHTYTELS